MVTRPAGTSPVALRLAAAAQAAEALGLCVAGVFSAISTVDGHSSELASGIALTVIAFGTAAALAGFALALDRARPWSRTPVVMTQLFVIIAGFTLLEGHRPEWGWAAMALAVGCLAGLFTPASVRALNRPPRPASQPAEAAPPKNQPPKNQSSQKQPPKNQPAKRPPGKNQPAKRPPGKRQPAK